MKIGIDYCPNPASKEFQELKSIFGEAKAYLLWDRNHGNPLDMAPNGAQSKLFQTYLDLFNGDREKALVAKSKVYSDEFFNWFGDWTSNNEEYLDSEGVTKDIQSDGKIKLSLPTSTKEHPRQIILEPQGDNKYYVHMKIWDGEKIPGEISDEDKHKLFNALYKELPVGAEILFPKSGEGYYATRGTVAGLMRLSRDERFSKGSEGVLQYEDKDGSIKEYKGTSFIKRDTDSVSKVVDENGEPLVVYHGGARNINAFKLPNNKAKISFDDIRNLKWAKREGYVISEEDLVRYNNGEEVEVTKPVGVYFAEDEVVSRSYFGRRNIEDDGLYATFLNIRNPYITNKEGKQMPDDAATVKDLQQAKDNDQDGVIIENVRDYGPNDEERMNWETNEFATHPTTDYIVFNPNQIKSATDNNGMFSTENDDIYYHLQPENAVIDSILQFCDRLGFKLQTEEDAKLFVDFTSKVITMSDFNDEEFNRLKSKIAVVLMPAKQKSKIQKVGDKLGRGSEEAIEEDIFNALQGQDNWISQDKSIIEIILDLISNIIDKVLKNQEYYERLIQDSAKEIANDNSKWYRQVVQEGFEQKNLDINKLKSSPLYNVYDVLTKLGAGLDGSAAIRTQGTLFRKNEEDFHDLDFSKPFDDFSWDVHEELNEFFNNYKIATDNFRNKDKIVYKDLRQQMLDNCTEHLRRSPIYRELSKHYKDITVKHAAKTKQLGLFVTLLVDGNPVDIFYPGKSIKTHDINGITVVDFSIPFAAKLVMHRDKDIRDIINFHQFENVQQQTDDDIQYRLLKSKVEYTEKLLKAEGLTHRWSANGGKSILFAKRTYDIAGNTHYPEYEIKDICKKTGVGYSLYESPSGKSMIVNLYDRIESASKNPAIPEVVLNLAQKLSNKFPGLTFKIVDEQDVPRNVRKNACCWTRGGVIYLINGRVTEEMTIEEFLHPFVSILQKYNPDYFYELVKEIKKLYPSLIKNIDAVYSDFEGFDQDTRDNEYVAQGLAKAMHESKHKNEKVLDILKSFGQWFIELLESFSEYWWHGYAKGSVYTIDPLKIKNLTVGELARLLNADDIEVDLSNYDGNKKTYYHMADPNATIEDISAEINKQFKILYDAYRKIPNKTEQQQRVKNKVFENLTQLRAQRDVTSIQIALKTGLDIIGTIDYNTGLPGDPNSVLGKLYALEQSTVPYSTATAKELVEMYRNSIGFFKSMLSDIPDSFYNLTTDANLAIALKKMRDDLQNRLNEANNKWKVALVSVTDKIVEEQIDAEVSLSQDVKDDMKTVYKDWLHTNLYYGDISAASSLLVNYGQNNNPIVRLAFHMIQRAESKIQFESQPISVKITKQYQRAQKEHYLQPDWQTIYMEFDKDGIPTGKWVRDINYGQYAKDVNEFIDKLNEEFLKKYKFYYILDDNDVLVNSATLQRGDEEEWVGNTEPPYVEYMRRIEQYKCSRAYRRYTYDYYKERFSRPYSQSYPSGHGLSPRTLSKYNRIQSNINYYLDLCTDKITGLHHPENLSDENKKKLDLWKHELDKLSDVFDEDGWLKTDEDLQMAEEIRAWESWIGEKMVTQTDLDLFLQERAEIETRVQNGEIPPKILTDFDRYNATFGINQDFINQTIGQFDNPKGEPSDVVEARMRRRCIADMVKLPFNKLDRDMSNFEDKKQLWVYQKLYDQTVEDGRVTRSKDMAEEFDKNFFMKDVLYRDENGYAVDTQGNIVQPQDESSRRDLLTFYEYMVQKYTDEALSSGTIAGLVDLQGNVYHFSGSRDEIESQVRELLSYTRRYTDAEGNLVEEQVPLTIFKVMYPRQDTFYNARTGRTENTLEYVPTGRFSYKTDNWANTSVKYVEDPTNYDRTSLQAEQPKRQYYDNSEQYKKATSGETGKLYDMLIQQMKDSQQDYNFGNPIFDYNLPQINATNAAVLSRCLRNGVGATLKYISDSINTVQENDDDMRSTKSGVVNPDGTFATDVPRRYINPLKDPATITHNITGAVMMYMHAAKNYKYKTIIEGQLEALRYAMDDDNREKDAVSVQHSKTTFDSMMDKHMYGNQWGNRNLNSQSGYDVARQKTLRNAHRLESVQMLGLNIISMTVGGSDSICKMFRDAIAAKHFSVRDLITGITSTLLHLPLLISNLGNPVANNKQVGVNQLFGIGKDYKMIYEHQDYGRTRKFVTNLLMGGYSMIDYVNNSILLRSNLSGIRFYNGNKIPKGFYTKWEMQQAFVQAGYSIYQGTLAHMCCTKTLWGAIKYKHGYTWISDDYSQYVSEKIMSDVRTRTLQRGGLYNGMNPDNDIPRYKQSVLWAIPLAMRAWLLQQWQHLFLGLDDTSVREFYEKNEESRKGLFKKRRTRRYMKKRTDEQRANRLTWNFETGVPQDEIGNGLSRSFVTLMKKLYAFVTLNKQKLKNVKFSCSS